MYTCTLCRAMTSDLAFLKLLGFHLDPKLFLGAPFGEVLSHEIISNSKFSINRQLTMDINKKYTVAYSKALIVNYS